MAIIVDRNPAIISFFAARSERNRIQPADRAHHPRPSGWQEEDFFIGIGGK
ncbi:hypothetical protein [Collimonas arenae]|uniref:hypothetical protein n=1 Tax=Collimonas arenae TaxID=279058 RepID=UPI0012E0670C|nr:hypothetical protein [Collimonas arenae]